MKESYREGVTNHPGPEPCEGGRKTALEALDRGICRLGIELRNRTNRDAHGVIAPQGNTAARASVSAQWSLGVEERTLWLANNLSVGNDLTFKARKTKNRGSCRPSSCLCFVAATPLQWS
jgi:hypothetical protein